MNFGARFRAALDARGPFCVGIDPHAALLHDWGLTDDVAGLERFALSVVDAVAPLCSVVKPQSAFYERFGSRGVAVLEQVIEASRAAGALVLLTKMGLEPVGLAAGLSVPVVSQVVWTSRRAFGRTRARSSA